MDNFLAMNLPSSNYVYRIYLFRSAFIASHLPYTSEFIQKKWSSEW